MSAQDDHDWFEGIAGRGAADAHRDTAKEAWLLREAVLATRDAPATVEFDPEAGLQRLLFRLRRERLLDDTKQRSTSIYWGLGIAASLVLVVGSIMFQQQTGVQIEDQAVFRGGAGAAQAIGDADPLRLGTELKAELEATGLKPRIVQFGDNVNIEADWPENPDAAQLEFLGKHKLQRPSEAQLRIEIRPVAR